MRKGLRFLLLRTTALCRTLWQGSTHVERNRSLTCLQGGSGQVFDWTNLTIPQGESLHGWLLAGGLLPSNVATAVQLASPTAVDVSSGVCGPDGEFLTAVLESSCRVLWQTGGKSREEGVEGGGTVGACFRPAWSDVNKCERLLCDNTRLAQGRVQ